MLLLAICNDFFFLNYWPQGHVTILDLLPNIKYILKYQTFKNSEDHLHCVSCRGISKMP